MVMMSYVKWTEYLKQLKFVEVNSLVLKDLPNLSNMRTKEMGP
jgi:hypothetical protein